MKRDRTVQISRQRAVCKQQLALAWMVNFSLVSPRLNTATARWATATESPSATAPRDIVFDDGVDRRLMYTPTELLTK
jgi:hypothetical protein